MAWVRESAPSQKEWVWRTAAKENRGAKAVNPGGAGGRRPRKIQSLGNCLGEITGGLRLNEQFLLIEHSQFVEAKPNAPFSVAA